MALPRKLKKMHLYGNGESYLSDAAEVTLPKISHAMEDWRDGGMLGPVKIDMGLEAMECEWTLGGMVPHAIKQMGAVELDAQMLRFMGAYQSDTDGAVSSVDILMRGRHQELDRGNAKPGDATEHKFKTVLSYYKETLDGEELMEIDMVRGIYIVGGVDRHAELRAAIGLEY
ncbi:MAG: phage major tail tube protein [Novosphingobium sp.]|nr:phage major tail tube protein [Novosphingobium sp.]